MKTTLRHGRDNGANLILLNGDAIDFYSISHWENDPRKRNLANELKTAKEFFEVLRQGFPKARIIYKLANHEHWWERYLSVKAPELLGVPDFELKNVLRLDNLGIESIGEKRPIRLGGLNILHGDEHAKGAFNPVNPARGLFLRAKAHSMCGHYHQSSHHSDRTVEQDVIGCWSLGCLCDLHPGFLPLNNWNLGFGFVEVFNSNKFNVKNAFIAGGRVY